MVLVGVTAVWGSTFFLLHGVVQRIDPADFLSLRFWIAAAALLLLAPAAVVRGTRQVLRTAVPLGAVYGAGQILQTVGLQSTSASVSGFVTGLYVVMTPLLAAVLLRRPPSRQVWAAVALATAGLGVLSLRGPGLFAGVGTGELLTAASALLYALHIVGLGAWSRRGEVYASAFVQMVTCSVVCTLAALPGGIEAPSTPADWWSLLYMAVAAGSLALLAQTWAQARVSATRAAIIMTLEPVWAGTFAVALGGESLHARLLVGGSLVLAAMALAELPARRRAVIPTAAPATIPAITPARSTADSLADGPADSPAGPATSGVKQLLRDGT